MIEDAVRGNCQTGVCGLPAHRRCNSHNSADGVSVGEGTGAGCSATLETSEPKAHDAVTDGGYYSPDSEDDLGCLLRAKQRAQDELEADTCSYSSVSEDDEQRGLGMIRGAILQIRMKMPALVMLLLTFSRGWPHKRAANDPCGTTRTT